MFSLFNANINKLEVKHIMFAAFAFDRTETCIAKKWLVITIKTLPCIEFGFMDIGQASWLILYLALPQGSHFGPTCFINYSDIKSIHQAYQHSNFWSSVSLNHTMVSQKINTQVWSHISNHKLTVIGYIMLINTNTLFGILNLTNSHIFVVAWI